MSALVSIEVAAVGWLFTAAVYAVAPSPVQFLVDVSASGAVAPPTSDALPLTLTCQSCASKNAVMGTAAPLRQSTIFFQIQLPNAIILLAHQMNALAMKPGTYHLLAVDSAVGPTLLSFWESVSDFAFSLSMAAAVYCAAENAILAPVSRSQYASSTDFLVSTSWLSYALAFLSKASATSFVRVLPSAVRADS
ncbi:hypothetical protein SANTM175S_08952 [Streptomyces antimycoticus]